MSIWLFIMPALKRLFDAMTAAFFIFITCSLFWWLDSSSVPRFKIRIRFDFVTKIFKMCTVKLSNLARTKSKSNRMRQINYTWNIFSHWIQLRFSSRQFHCNKDDIHLLQLCVYLKILSLKEWFKNKHSFKVYNFYPDNF
jgi:hypothetical protein